MPVAREWNSQVQNGANDVCCLSDGGWNQTLVSTLRHQIEGPVACGGKAGGPGVHYQHCLFIGEFHPPG